MESRSPYRRIQRIILESGILYSFGMFVTAITLAILTKPLLSLGMVLGEVLTYSQALLTPLAVSTLTLHHCKSFTRIYFLGHSSNTNCLESGQGNA